MTEFKNIHLLSNSPTRVNSGFGIVCRNLAIGLKNIGYNVSVSDMQNVYNIEYWNRIKIYPLNSVGGATGNDFYINELKQFVKNLRDSKADCVIFIYPCYDDIGVMNKLYEVHDNTFWYYPCEGQNLPLPWIKELSKVKKVIPMTHQGHDELKKRGLNGNLSNFIYHGYDPILFKEIDVSKDSEYCKWSCDNWQRIGDRKELCERGCFRCNNGKDLSSCKWYEKEKVIINFGDGGDELVGDVGKLSKIKDTFGVDCIYGFVGDNNGSRKRIDLLLNSYMSMSNDIKKDSMLLLHTLPFSGSGINLVNHIKKWEEKHGKNSSGKISFIYGNDGMGNSWSDKALNMFYNVIDINATCSGAEGFCLPALESMAAGKSQIAPRFSSFIELIGDDDNFDDKFNRGLLADLSGYETLSNGIRRGIVSTKSMSDCMKILYDDVSKRKKLGNMGAEWAIQYTWKNVVGDFDNVLRGREDKL